MRFGILGPLSVDEDGRELPVTAGRDRTVLAMLLLHANRIVSADELIDAVWGEDPPATARGQLQSCVSRLRRALPAVIIRTDPAGYAVEVAPDDLDATRFARLVEDGRYRTALELWRGPALAGLDSAVVRRYAAALDERYAVTVEDWVADELDQGHERDLIGHLSALVDRFPLRERLRGQLIRSLAAAGRRADALAEYRRAGEILRTELGIEPGPELQEVHRRVLTDEPAVSAGSAVRCLPRTVGDFTGRSGLVSALRTRLDAAPDGPVVQVIDGMAGVGKTTLAVHLARLVGDRYPDAHLFIDLHGHSDRRAVDPADALVTLLRQLGVRAERIPAASDDRIALWRSELAQRRVIVVLDNASTSAQVRPLLPGSGDNLTLITSRSRLAGLDGVRPESVHVLTEAEALDLFTQIVGDRARDEPQAAAEVVRRCGRLPLAIRLAGARLARRRRWRVADLVRRLGEAALPELASEDRTVAAAFALSYSQLSEPQQNLFRLLGLYPGERFEATVVAALGDLSADDAEDLLDSLVDVNLVEEPEAGSYRLHDLMREYAAMLVAADPDEVRRAALDRLFDHTLYCAAALAWPLETPMNRRSRRLGPAPRPDLLPGPEVAGLSWIDRQRGNYMAVLLLAESVGAHRQVWQLARAGWRLWYLRPYYDDLIDAHTRGLAAARAAGDTGAAATMANYLASGLHRVARVREAADLLGAAYAAYTEVGDGVGAHIVLGNLAVLHVTLGEFDAAVAAASQTLADSRRRQDLEAMTSSLNVLGTVADRRGDRAAALAWYRSLLMVSNVIGSTFGLYQTLTDLGVVRLGLGHPPGERIVRLAIALNNRFGNRSSVVEGHVALGAHYRQQGRLSAAVAEHRQALDLVGELAENQLHSITRTEFGLTLQAAGDRAAAVEMFRRAEALAR
ncbi:MAG TPA: BTAD domain-containing putative transcriptional regulator, partial [Actinoplanes sp.]|nr:BTAD domain-containing putative transcriptional regulator [Actinoplanes sp.]